LENSKDHLDNYLAACNNLGHIYKVTDNVEAGIEIMEKALSKAKQINDTNSLLLIENNLGFLYIKKERYSEAEKLGLDVVKQANQKQFEIHHANGNRLLGTVYYYLGDYKKSEVYIDQSIAFYRDFKNIELLRQSLDIKNKLLIKTEQFESAEKINSEIISLLDSVSLNSNVQNLQKNLVAYETEKKDNEIIILKQKDEISNFKIEKQKQHITSLFIAILIIGSIIAYNYSTDITKQKGLQFGNELSQIENELSEIQNKFYSEKTKWAEGDISKEELLKFYEEHIDNFQQTISKYDKLTPPELFQSSVVLLKMSAETQLESDLQFIEWIKTEDEASKIRSDALIQEAYEYQNLGLVEFQTAKVGIKHYVGGEKFEEPQGISPQKVVQVTEKMKDQCDDQFRNESGEFDSNEIEIEWFNCNNKAKEWKIEHMP
jgi:tetratricopeptide (TPR) repeat protein